MWKKVCGERNVIESKMRHLVVINLLIKYGKKNLKEKLIQYKDTSERDKLMSKELKDIVQNNFYLLDLKTLIIKN